MSVGDARGPIYRDTRDLTPFGNVQFQTPVRELAGTVGGLIHGVLGRRDPVLLAVDGEVPGSS